MFTTPTKYAIRALSHLVKEAPEGYLSVRELGKGAEVPQAFLAKLLTKLAKARIVDSRRGPNGGVCLAREAGKISVEDIEVAINGHSIHEHCILGFAECGNDNPCPLHDTWEALKPKLHAKMHSLTLADITASQ